MGKLLAVLASLVWMMLFMERPVLAYLDPGTGSMFLQLVLGGIAGVAVLGKLYWQRLVSFFTRKR